MPTTLARPPRQLRRKRVHVGPSDNGRHLSLDESEAAETPRNHTYELDRGTVRVEEAFGPRHRRILWALRDPLIAYGAAHRQHVNRVPCRGEAKVALSAYQSERWPDLAIYRNPPPEDFGSDNDWVPLIAAEVVTPESAVQDDDHKPAEYLAFGVQEYWMVDGRRRRLTVLSRWRGIWIRRVLRPAQTYTTGRLPGFSIDVAGLFQPPRFRR